MKKTIALLLVLICFPWLRVAAESVQYEARLLLYPENFSKDQQSTVSALAEGLASMALSGIYMAEEGKFASEGVLMILDRYPVTFSIKSNGTWCNLSSNLFGNEQLVLHMDGYHEFMFKPYNFMGLKTQYPALLTSRYANERVLVPLRDVLASYFAGEGDRNYTPKQVIACAETLKSAAFTDGGFYYFVRSLLLDVGLDSTVVELFALLPEWAEQMCGTEGLHAAVQGDQTVWTLGDMVIYTETVSDDAASYVVSFITPDDTLFTLSHRRTDAERALMLRAENSEEGLLLDFSVMALGLPEPEALSGSCKLHMDIQGCRLPAPIHEKARIEWERSEQDAVKADCLWLNAAGDIKARLAVRQIPIPIDRDKLSFSSRDLRKGTAVFTLVEDSMKELVTKISRPMLQTLLPVYLSLPLPFLNLVMRWVVDNGMAGMLLN